MSAITILLSGIALLIAAIPARFAMDMAGDIYKELLQEKWVNWIKHFKKHTDPKTAITTLKKYIKEDLKKMEGNQDENQGRSEQGPETNV